jgi:cell division protein FtsL
MDELINISIPTITILVTIVGVYFRLKYLAQRNQERLDEHIHRTEKDIDDLKKENQAVNLEIMDLVRHQNKK